MLHPDQPKALSPVELLQLASHLEDQIEVIEVRSYQDLLFDRKKDSIASKLEWSPSSFKSLARAAVPAIAPLIAHVPRAPFLSCFNACLPFQRNKIKKYGVFILVQSGVVAGVTPVRSKLVRPSVIMESLLDHQDLVYEVSLRPKSLHVAFKNSLLGENSPILVIRAMLENGWGLERSATSWDGKSSLDAVRFKKWGISNWQQALFQIQSELAVRQPQ